MSRIVVGIDGSDHARRALRATVEEARWRGADVDVVHAIPEVAPFLDPIGGPPSPKEELRAAAFEVLDQAVSGEDTREVRIERIVATGGTAKVLCEAALGADLLVVGSRGLGGFRGLLVGSVTQQVVAHAPCPVLVVVPDRNRGSGDG